MLNIKKFENRKCDELLKRGFPKEELWLTECERVNKNTGCLYYHESGNIYGYGTFTNEEEFQKCLNYLTYNITGNKKYQN